MKSKFFLILVVLVAIGALYLWPAPDPLNGVETIALASTSANGPNLSSDVANGVEFALGKHRIKIVSDPNQADAIIEIEPQSGDFEFSVDNEGFSGSASIRCLVRRNGQESIVYLNLTLDDNGFNAEFEGRKFWEVWK